MKALFVLLGIIVLFLLIRISFNKRQHIAEAFQTLPMENQSSYMPQDTPGAVTANPTLAKPTHKDIVDARDTVRAFLDLKRPQDLTAAQQYENLKLRAPIFLNLLDTLEQSPETTDASSFSSTVAEYKQAFQILRQVPDVEGFATIQQDAANLLDAISIFVDLYAQKEVGQLQSLTDRNFVNDLHASADRNSINIRNSSLPTDAIFAAKVQAMTSDYQRGAAMLSPLSNKLLTPPSSTGTLGSAAADAITLQGVKDLIANIQAEQLRLQNLRSVDVTVQTRIRVLEQLLNDLREIVRKVEAKAMRVEDIPIRASDAADFLAQYKGADRLPYLMQENGTTDTTMEPDVFAQEPMQSAAQGQPNMIPAEVLKYLKNLEWSLEIKVHNDPGIAYRERTLERIKELEQRIAAYAYNDVPVPLALQKAFERELEALTDTITRNYKASDERMRASEINTVDGEYDAQDDTVSAEDDAQNESLYARMNSTNTRIPTDDRLRNYNPFNEKDTTNPDAMYRPGFIMNDETIKHRGSAAYFDSSAVGGLDYKQRAKDLCRQIKSAQIGDPAQFGCIQNENAVSSSYSWRGNFEMVCNRLGDTWGSWYPEMFGCPKYDPTKRYDGAQFQ